MRLHKIFIVSLLAFSTAMLQSCLKNQEDVFEDTSSIRMQKTLDHAKEVLTGAEYGWAFDYIPDRNMSYGGFIYTVKFDHNDVTVGCELAPGSFEKSMYKLTDDNGPILSFDTYNTLMHYFATPGNNHYQAYDGDFEFMIMEATPELVTLRGNRTGNTMYMRPLTQDPDEYITSAAQMDENFFLTSATGTVGSTDIKCDIDLNARYMEFSWGESDASGEFYLPTATGIRFLSPVTINGSSISELSFDANTLTYTGTDSSGNALTMSGEIAEDYSFFDEFEGTYTFNYNSNRRKITLTFVPDKANNRYIIKGFNSNFDVIATYDKTTGYLEICSQQVGTDGEKLIWLDAWALDPEIGSGSHTWDTTVGMFIVKDPENPGTYNFISNNNPSLNITSFILFYFTGTPGGTPYGQVNDSKWYVNGSPQIVYISNIVKQ